MSRFYEMGADAQKVGLKLKTKLRREWSLRGYPVIRQTGLRLAHGAIAERDKHALLIRSVGECSIPSAGNVDG